MKRYRLLKDLGEHKAGEVWKLREPSIHAYPTAKATIENEKTFDSFPVELSMDPDWFEEVVPFVPNDGECWYLVGATLDTEQTQGHRTYDIPSMVKLGNCFRTFAEAEACAVEMRKLLADWKENNS